MAEPHKRVEEKSHDVREGGVQTPSGLSVVFQTFEGNEDSEAVVRHQLQHAVLARYVRLVPLGRSREGRVGLRLELYGCSYCKSGRTRRSSDVKRF